MSSQAGTSPPEGGGELLIKIKTLEPATYEVHVNKQITVAELKSKLEGIIANAPASRQRIIYRGRGLQDERTLRDAGIEEGDTLHMVVRPADAPDAASSGSGQAQAAPQFGQNRLEADTRRILEQINQTMNLNLGMGMGFNLRPQPAGQTTGSGNRQQQQQQQPPPLAQAQGPAPETPHLYASLHRYLQRLGDPSYAPLPVVLMSNANPVSSIQVEFEALSRAVTEVLGEAQLPDHLMGLRDEARRDPAGRGQPPSQQQQQQQAQADQEGPVRSSNAPEAGSRAQTGDEAAEERDRPAGAAAAANAPASSGADPGDGPRRARRRRGTQSSGEAEFYGTSYGYRYLPLATASFAELLDRSASHVSGALAQQLREGSGVLRDLSATREPTSETTEAAWRRLRQLSGQLHASAALLVDMSRAAWATAAALDDNPRTLASNATAAVLPDGTDAELPPMVPRRIIRGGGGPTPAGWDIGFMGPMGGFMDVIGAQLGMPVGPEGPAGPEDAVGGPAGPPGGAPGAPGGGVRGQGVAVSTVHIDLAELPGGLPGGLGGLLGNIINAVAAGAMPQQAGPAGGTAGGAPRGAPSAGSGAGGGGGGGAGAGAGPEPRRSRETPLSLLMPALTAVAGSIAAAVMQSLAGRGVQPQMLLDSLSRALSEHLTHVMDVLTSRWDGLQRAAARRSRAARARAQRQQPPPPPQQQPRSDGQAPAPGPAPAAAGPGSGAAAAAAAPAAPAAAAASDGDLLDEFRPVAQLINQLFSSWESVMRVPAEPAEGEEGVSDDEEEDAEAEDSSSGQEAQGAAAGQAAPGEAGQQPSQAGSGQRRRRRGAAAATESESSQRRAALDEDMTAMVRMLLPTMVHSIGRSVAQSVVAAVAPEAARSGSLDGQQLAMVVLQTLVSRLDGVANMLLANWGRISTGLEQIESGSEGASAVDMMSQMVNLAASIMGGGPAPPPPQPPMQSSRAAPPSNPATQQQPPAPPPTAGPTAAAAVPEPAQASSAPAPPAAPAAPETATASAAPADTKEPSAPASSSAPATATAEVAPSGSSSSAGASGAAPPAGAAAPSGPVPRGLGLGLRPTKKKPAPPSPPSAPAAPALAPGSAASAAADGSAAPAPAAGTGPAQPAATAAPDAAPASRAAAGVVGGDRAADPLDGLMEMMEQVLGTLDNRDAASGGAANPVAGDGAGGLAVGGGGGLGGLLQVAQNIVSDPAMQPMIGNMMNMVLGGGAGGAGGGGGGGLGGLLGSLLGGLPPAGGPRSGRSATAAAAEPIGFEVLSEVLGAEEGGRWRELIERDVEAMQQHVRAAEEEHSVNYQRGVPSKRSGLLSTLVGGEGNLAEGEEEEEEGEEEYEDGEEGEAEGEEAG